MKDAPRENRGQQAHPQSISHSGQAKTALPDWLHAADATSSDLTLQELVLEAGDLLNPRMRHTSGGR